MNPFGAPQVTQPLTKTRFRSVRHAPSTTLKWRERCCASSVAAAVPTVPMLTETFEPRTRMASPPIAYVVPDSSSKLRSELDAGGNVGGADGGGEFGLGGGVGGSGVVGGGVTGEG